MRVAVFIGVRTPSDAFEAEPGLQESICCPMQTKDVVSEGSTQTVAWS
jgi:hypothetical protein